MYKVFDMAMSDLITLLTSFINFLFTSLTNIANFFTTSLLGQIILGVMLFGIVLNAILHIFNRTK